MLLGITCRDEEMWSLFSLVSCVDKIRLESCIYPRLLKYHFSDSRTKRARCKRPEYTCLTSPVSVVAAELSKS